MTEKIKNQQPKDKIGSGTDPIHLIKLYEALKEAGLLLEKNIELLDKIFTKLSLKAEQMPIIKKAMGSGSDPWKLKDAQEFLDAIIFNAAFGKPSVIENNGWLVKVVSAEEPE